MKEQSLNLVCLYIYLWSSRWSVVSTQSEKGFIELQVSLSQGPCSSCLLPAMSPTPSSIRHNSRCLIKISKGNLFIEWKPTRIVSALHDEFSWYDDYHQDQGRVCYLYSKRPSCSLPLKGLILSWPQSP